MQKNKLYSVIILVVVLALGIKYSDFIFNYLNVIKTIISPLILGCVIAYVINIIINKIENIPILKNPNSKFFKFKRYISIIISLLIIVTIFFLIIQIVIPQLVDAVSVLVGGMPVVISKILNWVASSNNDWPQFEEFLKSLNLNWPQLIQKAISYITNGISGVFASTFFVISSIGGVIMQFVVATIFAIYILTGKEKLLYQLNTLSEVYLNEKYYKKLKYVITIAHDIFTKFIIGQCTEAVIIGILCTVFMIILKFPYASMIGTLVGATALLPVIGAYLGAFIGAFMIFTVNPMKAIGFLVFIVILQQLEGNLIYPRVVGSSVGLPGIWVLAAVTIGGGLGGIIGMLVAVPIAATAYKLIKKDVIKRKEKFDLT